MNSVTRLIGIDDEKGWRNALQQVETFDFYHMHGYHALAERRKEGKAFLFTFQYSGCAVLLPFLLRPLEEVPGLEGIGTSLFDATSVYGYSGPIASTAAHEIGPHFIAALDECLNSLAVVSLFSRLHPLIDQRWATHGGGITKRQGQTISIDLTKPEDEQVAAYRKTTRYDIRKLQTTGCVAAPDQGSSSLVEFVSLYHENMRRVGAAEHYFFDLNYFVDLLDLGCFELITCRNEGRMVAGALFSKCEAISQYHLSATSGDWLRSSPMKLIIDAARRWAKQNDCSVLHLGGGLGNNEDQLFKFKASFSPLRHDFCTWQWVINCEAYNALTRARNPSHSDEAGPNEGGFFPAYRAGLPAN